MVIGLEDLERSISILGQTEIKMPYTFSGVGKSIFSDVIARVMAEIGARGEVTFGELMGMFYHDVDKSTMDRIVQTLDSMGFAKLVYRDKKAIIKYVSDSAYVPKLDIDEKD